MRFWKNVNPNSVNDMDIYFSGSISGGRAYSEYYQELISILEKYGRVLTEHIGSAALGSSGEDLDSVRIYKRDLEFLENADIIIADVSTPSLGVGYELAWGVLNNVEVHALFDAASAKRLSAMVEGNSGIRVHRYDSPDDFRNICKNIFSQQKKP